MSIAHLVFMALAIADERHRPWLDVRADRRSSGLVGKADAPRQDVAAGRLRAAVGVGGLEREVGVRRNLLSRQNVGVLATFFTERVG